MFRALGGWSSGRQGKAPCARLSKVGELVLGEISRAYAGLLQHNFTKNRPFNHRWKQKNGRPPSLMVDVQPVMAMSSEGKEILISNRQLTSCEKYFKTSKCKRIHK